MQAVVIVTILALFQFVYFGVRVGSIRGKCGVRAPATTGDADFERMFRVQQNTMEQLVVFIPALWLYANYVNPLWGAGLGVAYLVGRFVYCAAYCKDPTRRSAGFMITFLPTAVMLVWVLIAALKSYF